MYACISLKLFWRKCVSRIIQFNCAAQKNSMDNKGNLIAIRFMFLNNVKMQFTEIPCTQLTILFNSK